MATASLSASARTGTGTGVARKLRQAGQVPAVVYGHGRAAQSITVVARDVDKLLSTIPAASTVIELSIDGATARTLIREIQRHPVKRSLVHIDFQELVAGEKITVNVPVRIVGIPDGVRNGGGILEETMHQIHLRVDPASIPDHIDVEVTALTIGHSVHVRDLVVPDGAVVLDEPGATICVVTAPKAVVEETPAAGAEGAAPTTAEPELIRKPKPEGEGEGE
jgi:large subunit ribosomal protein L25